MAGVHLPGAEQEGTPVDPEHHRQLTTTIDTSHILLEDQMDYYHARFESFQFFLPQNVQAMILWN